MLMMVNILFSPAQGKSDVSAPPVVLGGIVHPGVFLGGDRAERGQTKPLKSLVC